MGSFVVVRTRSCRRPTSGDDLEIIEKDRCAFCSPSFSCDLSEWVVLLSPECKTVRLEDVEVHPSEGAEDPRARLVEVRDEEDSTRFHDTHCLSYREFFFLVWKFVEEEEEDICGNAFGGKGECGRIVLEECV